LRIKEQETRLTLQEHDDGDEKTKIKPQKTGFEGSEYMSLEGKMSVPCQTPAVYYVSTSHIE